MWMKINRNGMDVPCERRRINTEISLSAIVFNYGNKYDIMERVSWVSEVCKRESKDVQEKEMKM